MSSKWRRFEVLLPLQFNDGRPVPAEWLAETVLEVVDQFGAATAEAQDGRLRAGRDRSAAEPSGGDHCFASAWCRFVSA
jgi:hypothetical protein